MKSRTFLAKPVKQSVQSILRTDYDYEQFMAGQMKNEDGEPVECAQANPDVLPEGTSYFGDPQPTRAQLLMGEAIRHLQGQQKSVYTLTMRESYSLAEAAQKLGISKSTAQVYRERALKFIQQYCQRHTTW